MLDTVVRGSYSFLPRESHFSQTEGRFISTLDLIIHSPVHKYLYKCFLRIVFCVPPEGDAGASPAPEPEGSTSQDAQGGGGPS